MRHLKTYKVYINEANTSFNIPKAEYDRGADIFAGTINKYKTVRESPKGSNKGPEVSQWLREVGVNPGLPWCMAFIYGVFDDIAKQLGTSNPLPKTAGVIAHWDSTDPSIRINLGDIIKNPEILKPGMIFVMHRVNAGGQKNLGHAGIVISVDPVKKTFTSIEGNTNDLGSGEGDRVGINLRNLSDPLLIGFTDYFGKARSPKFDEALTNKINTLTNEDQERIKFRSPITHKG